MNFEIVVSKLFAKENKRLGKKYKSLKNDYLLLLERLERNPFEGTDLGHGLRKVRFICFTSTTRKNVLLYLKKKYLIYLKN